MARECLTDNRTVALQKYTVATKTIGFKTALITDNRPVSIIFMPLDSRPMNAIATRNHTRSVSGVTFFTPTGQMPRREQIRWLALGLL
jgi:hypothetical protein